VDPNPNPKKMSSDPQHWYQATLFGPLVHGLTFKHSRVQIISDSDFDGQQIGKIRTSNAGVDYTVKTGTGM
jgi:hypothetical protein